MKIKILSHLKVGSYSGAIATFKIFLKISGKRSASIGRKLILIHSFILLTISLSYYDDIYMEEAQPQLVQIQVCQDFTFHNFY